MIKITKLIVEVGRGLSSFIWFIAPIHGAKLVRTQ
jgi:hypothetical protein